jgi:beta-mannosidase
MLYTPLRARSLTWRLQVTKNTNDRPRQFYEFGAFQSISATIDVWATNSTLESRNVQVVLRAFDLQSTWTYMNKSDTVVLQPNSSTEIHQNLPCPHPGDDETVPTPSHSVVVAASIVDVSTGEVLAKTVDWPQPYKYLDPPSPGFKTGLGAVTTDGTQVIKLSADRPVKGVF